jgi:DUF4097 and DUF4098 domain-containing protein YvlB
MRHSWTSVLSTLACLAGLLLAAPAVADRVEQTLDVEPGEILEVRVPSGNVEIETHGEDRVEISGRVSGLLDLVVEHESGRVRVFTEGRGLPFAFGRVDLRVRVPEEFGVDVVTSGGRIEIEELQGPVDAETSGGRIDLSQIEGDVRVRTSGGSIELREIEGDIEAFTSGGSIRGSEIDGPIDVGTSGGSIRLRDVSGAAEAETSGGSIEVRFREPAPARLHTTGGTIEVELVTDEGYDVDAHTVGGKVELDDAFVTSGRREKDRFVGTLNGGGPMIEAETMGGSVRIRAR